MDSNTIELIKQVGAVGFIAILLVKQNGKNFTRLLSITENNFNKLFEKVDDLVHKIDHTYLSCAEVEDLFNDVSESHKLKKLKVLIHAFESLKKASIDLEILKTSILNEFKTITKEEALKLNKIKSHKFDKDLGVKFLKLIDWEEFIIKTMEILTRSESVIELERDFFSLSDNFLISIRTKLKI